MNSPEEGRQEDLRRGGIEFDPRKDRANVEKHGISLALAAEMLPLAYVEDVRFAEPRFRVYGILNGLYCCVAGTRRVSGIRVISMRRARLKEIRKYVAKTAEL